MKQMKNVIKKISAVAMAFTLLGAGTAITKTDNSLKADAGVPPQYCSHNCGWHNVTYIYQCGCWYKIGNCNNCGSPVCKCL
jgi:hypothetical protein